MNKEQLQSLLPHRDAMLLLDQAEISEGAARGKYQFRGDEWFFQGHFPGRPVTPGVVLCEILAQSSAVLLSNGDTAGATPYLTGLDQVRFRQSVHPGDLFETECMIVKAKPPFYFARGLGRVAGKLCVTAEFSFALVKE